MVPVSIKTATLGPIQTLCNADSLQPSIVVVIERGCRQQDCCIRRRDCTLWVCLFRLFESYYRWKARHNGGTKCQCGVESSRGAKFPRNGNRSSNHTWNALRQRIAELRHCQSRHSLWVQHRIAPKTGGLADSKCPVDLSVDLSVRVLCSRPDHICTYMCLIVVCHV